MMIRPNRIGRRWLGIPAVTPRSLFLNGDDGFVFDFSNPASLFTDAAGATPLTAPGQTIGLACDKSRPRSPITSYAGVQASAGLRPTYGRAPKSRRNLLTYSEAFDNATWIKGVSGTASAPVVTPNAALAPNGEMTADLVQLRLNGALDSSFSWLYQNISVPSGVTRTTSFYVKAANPGDVGKVIRLSGATTNAVTLTADWQRVSNSALVAVGITISVGVRLRNIDGTSDSVDFHLWGGHFEDGAIVTPYQKVTTGFDITEARYPTYGYARFDGADDKLTITLPSALTGDLMLFGRNGSWIEAGVTLPSGAFDLGPTGTVLTPGILSALGDLVGAVIIGRTTTATERALALRYFAARGAAGWLVAGAEGVVNGTFTTDTAGWTFTNATGAVAGGELEFTATVSGAHNVQRGVAVTPGTPYLLSFDARLGTMTVLRYSVYNATGAANIIAPTTYAATAATKRFQFVFTPPAGCVTANVYMARDSGSAGTAYFDNVSCKPLTVGA